MGKTHGRDKDHDVTSLLSNLHLTRDSPTSKPHGSLSSASSARRRVHMVRKQELLQTMLSDISPGDQMQLDDPMQNTSEKIDYPMLLQISDLLRNTSLHNPMDQRGKVEDNSDGKWREERMRMKSYIKLLKSSGLTAEVHYAFLKQWQTVTAAHLSSPVFDSTRFWRDFIVHTSITNIALHCALLSVAGLQYTKLSSLSGREEADRRTTMQTAYRLRAEAERRLRFHHNESDHLVTVATHCCLLLFDQVSGNTEEWMGRLVSTKLAMRVARFSSRHSVGRYFFWIVATHDRLAAYLRNNHEPSVLDVDDLLWDKGMEVDANQNEFLDSSNNSLQQWGRVDKIGVLFSELTRIHTYIKRLTRHSTQDDFDHVDACLTRWKEKFPLDLQTYEYKGDMHDSSCFLHALTCNGGTRALALHCLFSEVMILRLCHTPIEFQKSKIHEHAMTICKLAQSLTSSAKLLDDSVSADMSMVLGSLYIAGLHLFSKDGKAWMERLLRWVCDVSANMYAERVADRLSEFWRELRTRPKAIELEAVVRDDNADAKSDAAMVAALIDCNITGMETD